MGVNPGGGGTEKLEIETSIATSPAHGSWDGSATQTLTRYRANLLPELFESLVTEVGEQVAEQTEVSFCKPLMPDNIAPPHTPPPGGNRHGDSLHVRPNPT